jgi:polar amino acid transport system permease protein
LPTLGGETVLQMKATPLVATITVIDIYAVSSRIRQDTFVVYEPLLLLAVVYMAIAGVIVLPVPLAGKPGATEDGVRVISARRP